MELLFFNTTLFKLYNTILFVVAFAFTIITNVFCFLGPLRCYNFIINILNFLFFIFFLLFNIFIYAFICMYIFIYIFFMYCIIIHIIHLLHTLQPFPLSVCTHIYMCPSLACMCMVCKYVFLFINQSLT